jgi:predicted porin
MHHHPHRNQRTAESVLVDPLARASCMLVAGLCLSSAAAAIDFGPFSLTGFAKAEVTRVSPYCKDNNCQRDPLAQKEFIWADELVQGKPYGAGTTDVTLLQPYLGFKYALPRGFKVDALLSQRWRDGKEDFKGFWYEKNVAVSHEDYGSLRIGAMTTRSWSFADYPYGSDVNVSDAWASSGAGYGLLTRAIRYTSRTFDVAEGDLVVEGTYDIGESGWKRNEPRLFELWVHYGRGDFVLDAMVQDTENGTPSAFGHGPFTGPFYDPIVDPLIGGNSQGIAMLMARYKVDARFEILGGLRANRWSGAYAKFLYSAADNPLGNYDLWSNAFNVDWSTDLGGGVYKGYSARSVDLMLGARYRFGKWIASTGMVHLGAASTDNPSERGQSNSATINTVGLKYEFGNGFEAYGFAGMVHYGRLGLAPTSMPSNSASTNVDSRIKKRGNWVGVGAVYTFR